MINLAGNLNKAEEYPFICGKRTSFSDALKNPSKVSGKVILFPGNYDEILYRPEMCGRAFEYNGYEEKWLVYDIELESRKCISEYNKHFDSKELQEIFKDFLKKDGLLIDG